MKNESKYIAMSFYCDVICKYYYVFLHLNEEPPNSKYSHMIYYRQS